MLNKSFLFGLVALVAAPLAFGAAPKPITKTFLGVEHKCITPTICWSEKYGFLISPNKKVLVYLNADVGKIPIVKKVQKNVYQAWVTYVTKPPINGIGQSIVLIQVDAKEQKQRTMQITIYDSDGKYIHTNNSPDNWEYVIPHSVGETVNKAVIEYGALAELIGEDDVKKIYAFRGLPE